MENLKYLNSYQDLETELKTKDEVYLLLYKKGSDLSECAVKNISDSMDSVKENLFFVDVSQVRDIHPVYNITSVPSLLQFNNGTFQKVFKGCNAPSFYKSVFENLTTSTGFDGSEKPRKQVTVYSTPSCSWCNKLKQYLRESNIPFRDVDVSKDPAVAQNLVKQTGQQGVPQTNINGQWIVGFDKPKIDKLLGING